MIPSFCPSLFLSVGFGVVEGEAINSQLSAHYQ